MRSLVVLFALIAVAVAAPQVAYSPVVAYQQPGQVSYVAPSAVSHQSRVDIVHNSPALAKSPVVAANYGPSFYGANPYYNALAQGYYGYPGYSGYPGYAPQPYAAHGRVFAY